MRGAVVSFLVWVLFSLLSGPMCGDWSTPFSHFLNLSLCSPAADMASFNWSHYFVDPGIEVRQSWESTAQEHLELSLCGRIIHAFWCHIARTLLPSFTCLLSFTLYWTLLWPNGGHCTHLLHSTHEFPAGKAFSTSDLLQYGKSVSEPCDHYRSRRSCRYTCVWKV